MDRIQELVKVLSDESVMSRTNTAEAQRLCKICFKPATTFKTRHALFEYSVSKICQSCQDYYEGYSVGAVIPSIEGIDLYLGCQDLNASQNYARHFDIS